jgi:FtsZ-binding cell division protein ZapB
MDIDTTGFELGMPTRVEMLDHQCHMLCNENDQLRQALANAQRNINKLVEINQELHAQIAVEQRRANSAYVEYVGLMNHARCRYGIELDKDGYAADPYKQVKARP